MFKFDKKSSSDTKRQPIKLENSIGLELDSSAEGLLAGIEEDINQKVKGNGVFARMLRGTVHITFYLLESDIRKRRFLNGEANPEERRFKL